jgi:hypothetical protein
MSKTTKKKLNPVTSNQEGVSVETTSEEESKASNGEVTIPKEGANAEAKAKTNKPKSKTRRKKSNRQKPTTNMKKPTIRKVPMATYDSGKKSLTLRRQAFVEGELGQFGLLEIPLGNLNELERQLVIATAKLSINYAKSHDVTEVPNGSKAGRSLEDKLVSIVERLGATHVPDDTSKEVCKEHAETDAKSVDA